MSASTFSSLNKSRRVWGASVLTWLISLAFFGPFLIYPVFKVLAGSVTQDGVFTPSLLLLPVRDPLIREAVRNSFVIGITTTLLASMLAFPLAYVSARKRFPFKNALTGLLLVPLILPPLVGAVGLRQLLGREGAINSLLQNASIISEPIDFLQQGALMVVITAALHLYPLIYLNLSASWSNVDPTLEEAAENQGANGWMIFRTVTLPLLLPGYLSGALIVFIFAFTDLGTPLIFNFRNVAAVQIFDAKTSFNVIGYVLAFWMTILAAGVFWVSRRYLDGGRIATLARGTTVARESAANKWELALIYLFFFSVIGLALLPHLGVIIGSFAYSWSGVWPDWTLENYTRIIEDPEGLAASSIKISLFCAVFSMLIDIIGGFALAYALTRGRIWGKTLLDTLAMLPLALPGLILAFGLLIGYTGTALDPIEYSPLPLLIISYAVRRLPYALRAVAAGLQQMSVTLEEASWNLGATPLQTMWRITRPLVTANLIAAGLLTFAFAVLEVSDSLILAANRDYAPIAQAIYQLTLQIGGGTFLACALGVIGMFILSLTFLIANRLIGKQLGSLFRA